MNTNDKYLKLVQMQNQAFKIIKIKQVEGFLIGMIP